MNDAITSLTITVTQQKVKVEELNAEEEARAKHIGEYEPTATFRSESERLHVDSMWTACGKEVLSKQHVAKTISIRGGNNKTISTRGSNNKRSQGTADHRRPH